MKSFVILKLNIHIFFDKVQHYPCRICPQRVVAEGFALRIKEIRPAVLDRHRGEVGDEPVAPEREARGFLKEDFVFTRSHAELGTHE